jgi:hypothetical protein
VAAVAELTVAHGGVGGAVVEVLLVLAIVLVFATIWLRERRVGRDDD